MDILETEEDTFSELARLSDPEYSEDKSDSESEKDFLEEDDVQSDLHSPDESEDEFVFSRSDLEEEEEAETTTHHTRKRPRQEEATQEFQVHGDKEDQEDEEEAGMESGDDEVEQTLLKNVIQVKKKVLWGENKYCWATKHAERVGRTPRRNIVLLKPSPKGAAKGETNPAQVFGLYIDESMINSIVNFTNQEIAVLKINYKNQSCIGETSFNEIKALIALLIYFGAQKQNHMRSELLWHESRDLRITRSIMPHRRFEFLINCLRFDQKDTRPARKETDPFAAIRDLWENFNQHCQELYTPQAYCTIDEQLLGFSGKCPFRMYTPNKPAKYGIKIVMMCSSNGYLMNAIPYIEKKLNTEGKHQASFFVEKLSQPIHDTNRNITDDNWFSSVPLFNDMLKNHKLTMVGTLCKNKREIPPEVLKNRPAETSLFLYDRELTMVSYAAKKNKTVILLSNMHQGCTFKKDTNLPEIIHFYNCTKGGVDIFDQMSAQYSCSRKTRRWPLCIFYGLLNSAGVNSYIIYKDNMLSANQTPIPRLDFLFMLAEDLMKPWMQERLNNMAIRKSIRSAIASQLGVKVPVPPPGAVKPRAQRCSICPRSKDTKTTILCADCNQFSCKNHVKTVFVNCSEEN
ncbi:uncharacterized protein LOC120353426 [Nilaparvata lugens]|uniref:uncharacterized protein LOC120353426 n=1 Tax=Nilaparvata lugens TaxID=108931 RepID=UPI00193DCFD6|nr:uncharacterized protein LOC120353426 [Nilaparvata lugens]